MIPTTRKLECQEIIETNISTPSKNYFVKNESSIRLCYFIKGKRRIRYIILSSRKAVAEFLQLHGVIKWFEEDVAGSVKMYTPKFEVNLLPGREAMFTGSFYLTEVREEFFWNDIDFTPAVVRHYAALHEMEIADSKMEPGKVVPMFRGLFKDAA